MFNVNKGNTIGKTRNSKKSKKTNTKAVYHDLNSPHEIPKGHLGIDGKSVIEGKITAYFEDIKLYEKYVREGKDPLSFPVASPDKKTSRKGKGSGKKSKK